MAFKTCWFLEWSFLGRLEYLLNPFITERDWERGVPIELHTSSVHLFEAVGVFPVEHGCFVG